ncbi:MULTISPECIES: hypothetical protein [Stappiaceae]|jgi:hypothetical protein|uniref:hypothetical protein n=1 Tax=Stappiaceae TaxID=2821832 RepID=UPI0012689741|nr:MULTISPECIES: hypothetical protein [Stappiaceae]MBN8183387.1 hypothetical protein [Roseibium aggregatum]NKX63475.1 hypothetical protein [Labrenzia sp. 5N]QFS96365.1 hypothetical protein FIV06_02970 [Labrenzia sp. THAF191b]QFT02680.1 hypothetical protein FIV05_02970 [Labrenzia sp. THAF191a]QFT14222.1 hypothetical protein FIV03_02975 [Labrenzia sp. THAF187b]
MTSSLLDGRKIRTISIVGNGPISEADAPEIDKADLVLRFNSAPALGVAGQRIDVLMLNRARVYMSKRINPLALERAPEVWVNDIKENGEVDWLFARECKPRYLGFGPTNKAREHLKRFDPFDRSNPTSGASIIAEFLDVLPDAEIHLFGFTHQGKQHTHDWDAEKQWVQQLCDEGRIHKHLTPGPKPRRSLKGKLEYAFRFLEKRAKHYLHNKILHSSESTKRRIFGQDA